MEGPFRLSSTTSARVNLQLPLPTPQTTAAATAPPARLSPSALDRFRQCPRRFYWQDVLNIREKEELSPVLVRALATHRVLAIFYSLAPEDRSEQVIGRILRSVWREIVPAGAMPRKEEKACGLETEALLLRFYNGPFDTNIVPAACERWDNVRLGNGTTIYGRIDRLDHARSLDGAEPYGSLQVVDYKTARRQLAEEELIDDSALIFAAVATDRLRPVSALRLVYLLNEAEVRAEIEPEDVEAMRERLVQLTSAIQAETEWPAIAGDHCRFCPFGQALACPDAQRLELKDLKDVPEDVGF